MTQNIVAAISAILLLAANLPAKSETVGIPADTHFPSSVGEVIFKHKEHVQDRAIKCVECHHQISAKQLKTPHPNYFKSSAINCGNCHGESEKTRQKAYTCSECHRTTPVNIADETLSAKVVVHKQCWTCHQVGAGKDASKGCEECHSGKKTF